MIDMPAKRTINTNEGGSHLLSRCDFESEYGEPLAGRLWLEAATSSIEEAVIAVTIHSEPKFAFLNPVAEKLTGWNAEEARAQPIHDLCQFIDLSTGKKINCLFSQAISTKQTIEIHSNIALVSRLNRQYRIQGRITPIFNDQNAISGLVLVLKEVSSTKSPSKNRDLFKRFAQSGKKQYELFTQAPVPIAIVDGNTRKISLTNPSWQRIFSDQFETSNLSEIFTRDSLTELKKALDQVFNTNLSYQNKEYRLIIKDQDKRECEFFVNLMCHPLRNPKFGHLDALIVLQELTDQVLSRKEIEKAKLAIENERENFRNLFRQTPECICILSGPEHRFEFVNNAHIKILGFDATGQTVREAQPESIEVHGLLDDVFRTGITFQQDEVPVTVGGSLRYFNLTYAARKDEDGSINGVMILGSEVTDKVHARQAIIEAKEAADAANAEKSNFVANMSHEVRTPIGIIQGFCEILQDEGLPHHDRQEFIQRIIRNTKSLSRIIDDILDISKVEAGKVQIVSQEFELGDFLNELTSLYTDQIAEKKIYLKLSLDTSAPRKLRTDPVRLRQILLNVIGNAIKFTDSGGVELKISSKMETDCRRRLEFRIIDTGIGLSSSQASKLFQPFVQADGSRSRKYGGTGLGLAISKRLALALGGDIRIETCGLGEGTSFLLTLFEEFDKAEGQEQSTAIEVSPQDLKSTASRKKFPLSGLKVLVAEDSLDNQKLMTLILKKHGAEVVVADNGSQAIEQAMQSACDLVLMDIQMPLVNGFEATRTLRASGFQKPIIALTAHAMPEERDRTIEAGCNAHLTKPINIPELLKVIEIHTTQIYH